MTPRHPAADTGSSLPPGPRAEWPQIAFLRESAASFHARGWSLGTGGNYSAVLSTAPLRLVVSASGRPKDRLGPDDFAVIDETGRAIGPDEPRPSAEALLHATIASRPGVGAIFHTHSTWATTLSDLFADHGGVPIQGYEMLKGLAGVQTHEHRQWVEILENTQDIPALAARLRGRLHDAAQPMRHGFLLRRHGLYTWGADLEEARRHVETFEFLFEVFGRKLQLEAAASHFPPRGASMP